MSGSMPHDPKSQCVLHKFLSQEWVTKHVTSSQLGSLTKHVTWYHIENVTMCYGGQKLLWCIVVQIELC